MSLEFVVVFRENIEKFEMTVGNVMEQIGRDDRITVISSDDMSKIKSLKVLKKNKDIIRFEHAETIQSGYNLVIEKSTSDFMVFMHEGDYLGEDFVKITSGVYSGEILQEEKICLHL